MEGPESTWKFPDHAWKHPETHTDNYLIPKFTLFLMKSFFPETCHCHHKHYRPGKILSELFLQFVTGSLPENLPSELLSGPKLYQEGPRKTKPKKGQFMNFRRGIPEQKFNVNRACFPKENTRITKRAKFMNFSFWLFLWFGLPGRLLIIADPEKYFQELISEKLLIFFCGMGLVWKLIIVSSNFQALLLLQDKLLESVWKRLSPVKRSWKLLDPPFQN